MNRTELLEAFTPVESLGEVVVPKKGGSSEFLIKDDGLYWRSSDVADELKVVDEAIPQLFRHVPGLSAPAVKEWPVELLLEPVNWWYQHGDGEVRALYNQDGEVLSFTKRPASGINSPARLVEAVEDALSDQGVTEDSIYYDKVRVGLDKVSFAVVTNERSEAIKVGDVFDAGIMVFGSPTGDYYTEVSPYLNRLLCTNGMISPVALGRFSQRAFEGSIYDWARESTFAAWDAIDGELNAVRTLTGIEVDGHLPSVMADLFDRHHVPARQREDVLQALTEEADGTLFGVAQAFNRVANDIEDVAGMRHLLMVTGDIAHQTERCSNCLRAMN